MPVLFRRAPVPAEVPELHDTVIPDSPREYAGPWPPTAVSLQTASRDQLKVMCYEAGGNQTQIEGKTVKQLKALLAELTGTAA